MKYIIYILGIYIFAIKEFIFSLGNITYENHKKWVINSFNLGKFLCGWKYNFDYTNILYNDINDIKNENKILLISNHVSFIDAFSINYIIATRFKDYTAIYITREQFASIPIIGKYLCNNHILVKYKSEEDIIHIKKQINTLTKKYEKTILILFPEGKLMDINSRSKSNIWCHKIGIPEYKKCLAPHTNGIYNVLKTYKPDTIISAHIEYPDDPDFKKGNKYKDLINNNFPKKFNITFKYINNFINNKFKSKQEFNKELYYFWRKEHDIN